MRIWSRMVAVASAALVAVPTLALTRPAPAHALGTLANIVGEVERLSVDNPNDVWSGGTIVVGGQNITIPRNLLIDYPANRLTLQQTFNQAPLECVARGESGLAKADGCNNNSGGGATATITANRTAGGNVIAGDLFFQKGTELVSGVVSFIDLTDGYFRLNGNPADPATGV
ncbi:MAG TPA: hypothetical protein VKI64_11430, partial [Acidimicrobiales bacterium]|nr:hypothetical protein [Acidimicrobiales bacterium]